MRRTAEIDGYRYTIGMEQEPGSAGISLIDHYARNILNGYAYKGHRATGSKVIRANPASCAAEKRHIKVVRGNWNSDFFDELEAFPNGEHDDQVDTLSGAFDLLRGKVAYSAPIEIGTGESIWNEDYTAYA